MNGDSVEERPSVAKWRAAAWIFGSALVVLLGTAGVMAALGWRLQRLERAEPGGSSAGGYASAEKWSPPLGPGESPASRLKRLGHELAALSIAPTNRPDPGQVFAEAQSLAAKGRYEEALQRHIWYHNHALEYDSSQTGVRLSFALSAWVELGRKYPKARQALIEIRDRDDRELTEGPGDAVLFLELCSINRVLRAGDDTVAVFKGIRKVDPDLAKQCYPIAEDLLVEKQEYALCLGFLGDPQERFNSIREEMERRAKVPYATPQVQAMIQKHAADGFVKQVRAMVEILVASGRKGEAESICSQAKSVMQDPRLNLAISDAERRVAK